MRGTDIRRYRRSIRLSQAEFAARLGISQSALSRLEGGRIVVSEEHLGMLDRAFTGAGVAPTFAEFRLALSEHQRAQHSALRSTEGRFLLQTVWEWDEGFDLATCPAADLRVGVVAIPMTNKATIAFRMARPAGNWNKGETLVFEECGFKDLQPGDACLVQYRRDQKPVTSLAVVESGRSMLRLRGVGARGLQILEESLIILLRATTRVVSL